MNNGLNIVVEGELAAESTSWSKDKKVFCIRRIRIPLSNRKMRILIWEYQDPDIKGVL